MHLTVRDKEHQRRGHWHFNPKQKTTDLFWAKRSIPLDICQRAVNIILPFAEHCYYFNLYNENFVNSMPVFDKDNGIVKPTLAYKTATEPEAIQDALDTLNDFIKGQVEPRRPWHQTIAAKKIPGLMPWFEEELAAWGYLDNKELLDWRILVQWPGQLTYKHIDHVFVDYDKRVDRFERPPTAGNKYYTLLTPPSKGDYLQWGNELVSNWTPGDSFTWNWGLPHFAGNYSNKPRVAMMANLTSTHVPSDFADERIL